MGCSISHILFMAAFEVILIGARWVVGGVRLSSSQIPRPHPTPPLRGFIDDITSLLPTAPCTARLLRRMNELMSWARMKIKPAKS